MRRFLLLLILACLTSQGIKAVPAVVQAKSATTASTATTVTISTTLNNQLVSFTYEDASASATLGMTDSASQSWLTVGCFTIGTAKYCMFYIESSASLTFATCTSTTSATLPCIIYEVSGLASSSTLDVSTSSSATGTATSLASGTISTTQANEIIFYGVGNAATQGSWSAGSGYTIDPGGALPSTGQATNGRAGMQRKIVSSTQAGTSTTLSWGNTATDRGGIIAAFSSTPVTPLIGCPTKLSLTGAGC